jgi:nicotinamidase/pyrazinamidase
METTDEIITLTGSDALIVIDTQIAFMAKLGGGLGIPFAHTIIPTILQVMRLFRRRQRIATLDMHPLGHISRLSSYLYRTSGEIHLKQVLANKIWLSPKAQFTLAQLAEELRQLPGNKLYVWNDHAGVETEECQMHPALSKNAFWFVLLKGVCPWVDSFSAFRDNRWHSTYLAHLLKSMGVKRVFLMGLAYDFCVGFSAEDAAKEGFEVYIITDATASVDLPANDDTGYPGSVAAMNARLDDWGVKRVLSSQLRANTR